MNIVHEYHANMRWLELEGDYYAWYEYIRNRIFQGDHWYA